MELRTCRLIALTVTPLFLAACQPQTDGSGEPAPGKAQPPAVSSPAMPAPARMPRLLRLPSVEAARRLGQIEARVNLGLTPSWGRPVSVHCDARPGTVVRQKPAPGTRLGRGTEVLIRTAALDLDEFRGPCDPRDADLGPVGGPDAVLARRFYRFAANTSLGAPFATGEVWTGIANGLAAARLGNGERERLEAWRPETDYAERTGPFSALDVVASSGGYYELHRGIARTCASGKVEAPHELAGLRAITLSAPADTTDSCSDWWAVTLFLDGDGKIRGVALRLGSP